MAEVSLINRYWVKSTWAMFLEILDLDVNRKDRNDIKVWKFRKMCKWHRVSCVAVVGGTSDLFGMA